MPRARIAPGTVGPVAVVPLGHPAEEDSQTETVIPAPATDAGEPLPYPKGWKAGDLVKVEREWELTEYRITRWRGLARAVDFDGTEHMVRRWRPTRAAAESSTRKAGLDKLASLARTRDAVDAAARAAAEGDTATTVADMVASWFGSPSFAKLAPKTQQDYRYAAEHVTRARIGAMLPRCVDVAAVRKFLSECATEHGSGGARHARAVLSKAMGLAVETAALRVSFNPVAAARDAIPTVFVRSTGLDHSKAPSDADVEALLSALRADPEAQPMVPGKRSKSAHGAVGTAPVNGKDIADLAVILFRTGARIGEVAALRWADVDLAGATLSISGTLVSVVGQGTVRSERTKTKASTRTVPLAPDAVEVLRQRCELFGISGEADLSRPVFGSPQAPERWRDYRNLSRAISGLFTRHGLEYGRGHVGRKWRVTSLVERGVPIHKAADLVGHGSVKTTFGYLGRGRQTDADVRAAL